MRCFLSKAVPSQMGSEGNWCSWHGASCFDAFFSICHNALEIFLSDHPFVFSAGRAEQQPLISCLDGAKTRQSLKSLQFCFLSRCVPGLCWITSLIFYPQITQRNFQSLIMNLDVQIILGLLSDPRVFVWIFCSFWKFQPKEQNKGEGLQI